MANFDIFYTGALSVLKQLGHVSQAEGDNLCDAVVISTSEWAQKGEKPYKNSDERIELEFNKTPVAALMNYQEWAEKWPGLPKVIELSTVSLSVSIPLASGSTMQFSASAIVLDRKQIARAYTELYDEILKGYEGFRSARKLDVARNAPSNQPAQPQARDNGKPRGSEDKSLVPVEIVRVESKGGKRIVKLGGDIWSKFGVTCWPEVFDAAGWDPDDYELGETPAPKGWMMRLEMNAEGKPRKVKELFRG